MKKYNNTLFIDTRDNKNIIIRVETKNNAFEERSEANVNKAQTILPMVAKLLKKAKLKPQEIDEIKVETGPGAFTGLRVGVSIANALSFSTGATINGKPFGEIELPTY